MSSIYSPAGATDRMNAAEAEIIKVVNILTERRDWENAYRFSVNLANTNRKIEYMNLMVNVDGVPPLIKAKGQAELLTLLPGSENDDLRKELRESAKATFVNEHRFAAFDLDIGEAIDGLQSGDWPKISKLLEQYEMLDYPNGLKGWLHRLLDTAMTLHNYKLQRDLENELAKLSAITGTDCLTKAQQVTDIARFHQKTGNEDLIKSSLLRLWNDLDNFDTPFTLGHVGFILTDQFIKSNDTVQAAYWAAACDRHWQVCPPETQSMGHFQLLRSRTLSFQKTAFSDYQELQRCYNTLVEFDTTHNLYKQAVTKLGVILDVFFTCKRISRQERVEQTEHCMKRITDLLEIIVDNDTRMQKAGLLQQKATFYHMLASEDQGCEMEFRALEALKEALSLTWEASGRSLTF